MMGPFKHDSFNDGLVDLTFNLFDHGTRLLQENSTTGCFDTGAVYPVVEGELKKFAMKMYGESLSSGIVVTNTEFTVTADKEIGSSEGECNNIRFILDEELSFFIEDKDNVILGDMATLPFMSVDNQELLQNFKQNEVYFTRFGRMDGPHVTDPTLPTRMPSSSSLPTMLPSTVPSVNPTYLVSARLLYIAAPKSSLINCSMFPFINHSHR